MQPLDPFHLPNFSSGLGPPNCLNKALTSPIPRAQATLPPEAAPPRGTGLCTQPSGWQETDLDDCHISFP